MPKTASHVGAEGGWHTASAARSTSSVKESAMDSSKAALNAALGMVRMGKHKAWWRRWNSNRQVVHRKAGNDGE